MGSSGSTHGGGAADAILIEPSNVQNAFNVVQVSEDVIQRLTGASKNNIQQADSATNQLLTEMTAKSALIEQRLKDEQRQSRILKEELKRSKSQEQILRDKLSKSQAALEELKSQPIATTNTTSSTAQFDKISTARESAKDEIRFYQQKLDEVLQQQESWQRQATEKFQQNLSNFERSVRSHDFVSFCVDAENEVLKCYQENPKQTLKCSNQARQFLNCVQTYKDKSNS